MSHFQASFHYHLPRLKEMGRVYWCHSVGSLGISLVMIFVPIFLLKTGFSFSEVLFYLLTQHIFAAVLQYPVSKSFQFIRPHYVLVLGNLFFIAFFVLLGTITIYDWPLLLLSLVWAINRTLYWTAFHYIFSLARRHQKAGRQIAGINVLTTLAVTVATAIGGIVATIFGITYVYAASIVLLMVAVVPMFSNKNSIQKISTSFTFTQLWEMRRDAIANMFNGVVIIGEFSIWPLLVFTVVSTYAGVGVLSSVIALVTIGVTIYIGRREETRGERRYIKEGLFVYSLTNIGRTIVQNSFQIFGLNLLGGIGRSLYITPFMNRYYTNSDGPFRLGYISLMETAFCLGTALYMGILLVLSSVLPMASVLSIGLAMVALGVVGVRLIR